MLEMDLYIYKELSHPVILDINYILKFLTSWYLGISKEGIIIKLYNL